jgi:hypothetical protein
MCGYILRFLPLGVGMGLFPSPNNSAIMGSAPKHRLEWPMGCSRSRV